MKYVYDGIPEHEARLCFVGEKIPIYMMSQYDIDNYVSTNAHKTKEQREYEEKLKWDISQLEVSVRTKNICKQNNIHTLGELISLTVLEFSRFRNAGQTTVKNVIEALAKEGLSFRKEDVEITHELPRIGSDYSYYSCSDV